ncbi:MAG: glycoside hydrolase family 3 N-terminal domain-containing protein [Hyphomicrobium sp.]
MAGNVAVAGFGYAFAPFISVELIRPDRIACTSYAVRRRATRGDRPGSAWVRVGHTYLPALDPDRPASASRAVIDRLHSLGHSGIVITDDFSMGAIRKTPTGIGGADVAALNAGVDLILVSYDSDQIYFTLHALLTAAKSAGQSHMARNVGWVDEGDPTNSSDQSCWVSCLDPTYVLLLRPTTSYVQMRFPWLSQEHSISSC